MVPNGWTEQRIEDVLERVAIPVDVAKDELYQQIGIRSHAKGLFDKKHVTGAVLGNKRVFWIAPDCFIVNIVFAWEQAIGKTTDADIGKIASHRFPMYQPKENKSNVDFFLYFFKSKYGKHLLTLASPGGAGRNKTLGQKEFGKTTICLPPQPEQMKIAKILSTWDKAIETTTKLIENAEAQKKALMQQLLTGKKRFPEFKSIEWQTVHLEDIAEVVMGSSPSSSCYNEHQIGLPLIQGNADIKNRISAPRVFTSEITKECMVGDLLLSVRAPVGTISKSQHHACIGRGVAAIRAKATFSKTLLTELLLDAESKWKRFSQGSTFEAINSSDVRKLKLFCSKSIDEQNKIGLILENKGSEILVLKTQLTSLQDQKKALMQQLLTGKRRVKIDGGA